MINELILDNDGLDTVGVSASNSILCDHDNDGIQTGTGWVKPDDGFLVFDRNGNGAIDNGTELFGDATDGSLTALSPWPRKTPTRMARSMY